MEAETGAAEIDDAPGRVGYCNKMLQVGLDTATRCSR